MRVMSSAVHAGWRHLFRIVGFVFLAAAPALNGCSCEARALFFESDAAIVHTHRHDASTPLDDAGIADRGPGRDGDGTNPDAGGTPDANGGDGGTGTGPDSDTDATPDSGALDSGADNDGGTTDYRPPPEFPLLIPLPQGGFPTGLEVTADGKIILPVFLCFFAPNGGGCWAFTTMLDEKGRFETSFGFGSASTRWSVNAPGTRPVIVAEGPEYGLEFKQGSPLLVGLSEDGGIDWVRSIGVLDGRGTINSVAEDRGGGHTVAGGSQMYGATGQGAWVFRLGADKTIAWQKEVLAGIESVFSAVLSTRDGGNLAFGGFRISDGTGYETLAVKVDGLGNPVWVRSLGPGLIGSARGTADGGFILTIRNFVMAAIGAGPEKYPPYETLCAISRLDPEGSPVWRRNCGKSTVISDARELAAGGFALAGISIAVEGSASWIARLDGSGNPLWQAGYSEEDPAFASGALYVAETGDSRLLFSGFQTPKDPGAIGPGGVTLVRLDPADGRIEGQCHGMRAATATVELSPEPPDSFPLAASIRETAAVAWDDFHEDYAFVWRDPGSLEPIAPYSRCELVWPGNTYFDNAVEFEPVYLEAADCAATQNVQIHNSSEDAALDVSLLSRPLPPFSIDETGLPAAVPPLGFAEIPVTYRPQGPGRNTGGFRLGLDDGAVSSEGSVSLVGSALMPTEQVDRFHVRCHLFPPPDILMCIDVGPGMDHHQKRLASQMSELLVREDRVSVLTPALAGPAVSPSGDLNLPGVLFHKQGYPAIVTDSLDDFRPRAFDPVPAWPDGARAAVFANATPGEFDIGSPHGCIDAVARAVTSIENFGLTLGSIIILSNRDDESTADLGGLFDAGILPYYRLDLTIIAPFDRDGSGKDLPTAAPCPGRPATQAAQRYLDSYVSAYSKLGYSIGGLVSICNDDWVLPESLRLYLSGYADHQSFKLKRFASWDGLTVTVNGRQLEKDGTRPDFYGAEDELSISALFQLHCDDIVEARYTPACVQVSERP